MESTLWYPISFCIIFAICFILWILKHFLPDLQTRYLRHLKYPILIQRRRYWDSVTRFEALLLLLFLATNLVIILVPFNSHTKSITWKQVERRCAFAACVNMVPLCLGGRMGPIVQALNIHRSSYLFFHHWIGRVAILEAVSHATIMLSLQPRPGALLTSGWAVSDPWLYDNKLT